MKRIQIKKLGIVTNQAELPEPEASAWLEQGQREHWFGKPARYESQQFLVSEERTEEREVFDDEGNSFDPKQFETITIPAEYEWREVLIEPAEEFEVVVEDITAELEAARIKKERDETRKKAAKTLLESSPVGASNSVAALRTRLAAIEDLLEIERN
jgi:hypothetical protein